MRALKDPFEGDVGARLRREVVTPEGVPLFWSVATAGDRAVAFTIDLAIVVGAFAAIYVVAIATWMAVRSEWWFGFVLLGLFLLRNCYFTFFELRWQGATPGKRIIGLRVLDRRGGPLRADAVIARNLTRELEVFLPLTALLAPSAVWSDATPGWVKGLTALWLAVAALLPLFNRDRLRIGDLVAGTLVVIRPRVALYADLAESRPARHEFTPAQLQAYGVYELQVLEDLLRDEATPEHRRTIAAVAAKVRGKIGWTEPVADDRAFLADFYAAERAHLERGMLLGKRRADKHG
jgi:uncharacterized RDD family membrane protein YckC